MFSGSSRTTVEGFSEGVLTLQRLYTRGACVLRMTCGRTTSVTLALAATMCGVADPADPDAAHSRSWMAITSSRAGVIRITPELPELPESE